MQKCEDADKVKRSFFGLLKISDLVCRRAGLSRNCLGSDVALNAIPQTLIDQLPEFSGYVLISHDDLGRNRS